jgi:predicted ATPase
VVHLGAVRRKRGKGASSDVFPFSVPAIRSLVELHLDASVTFFVGENGSGKSTLLEALAVAAGVPAVGSDNVLDDATLSAQRQLARQLTLEWKRRTHRGFFLRAEDFFGFAKRLATMRVELEHRLVEIDEEYRDRSAYARGLAAGPVHGSLREMEARYGLDLDANSHGQSFLRLFQSRIVPDGLYLLDEPEAPLSPQSQLALMALIADAVAEGAQFIVATHSPILLAYPGARIFSFDGGAVTEVAFGDLEHVNLTRDFLNEPGRFLRRLMADPEPGDAEG